MQRQAPTASVASGPSPPAVVRVPVEVIEKGSAPEWVYVQVGNQAVPEPGAITLVMLAGTLLVLRRQRP